MGGKSCNKSRQSLWQFLWTYVTEGGEKSVAAIIPVMFLQGLLSGFLAPLKRKMMTYAVALVLAIASITVIIYGLGAVLDSLFPQLLSGTGPVLVGVLFLIIGWLYARSA